MFGEKYQGSLGLLVAFLVDKDDPLLFSPGFSSVICRVEYNFLKKSQTKTSTN